MGKKRARRRPEVENTPTGLFAANLERLMVKAGMTPEELAEHTGVTRDMIYKYLRGSGTPDLNRWPAIAKALGLDDIRKLLPEMPSRKP